MTPVVFALLAALAPPPELAALSDLAQSAPADVAAAALLRLAADSRFPDEIRPALLEQAFEKAAAAREPRPWRMMPRRAAVEAATYRAMGYELGLDKLTLQSRAVAALARVQPVRARRLFEQIVFPEVAPLTCADTLWPAVDPYFHAAGAVANNAFSAAERRKEAHVAFLDSILGRVTSPVALAPAMRLLQEATLTESQRETLTSRLLAMMETVNGDDRSFSSSVQSAGEAFTRWNEASALPVWRAYLLRHLKQARCRDTVDVETQVGQIVRAQAQLFGVDSDAKPERVLEAPVDPASIEAPEWSALRDHYRALLTDSARGTPAWKIRVDAYLAAVEQMPVAAGGPAATFDRKIALFSSAVYLLGDGPERARALVRLAGLLTSDPLQNEQPAVWLALADQVMRSSVTQSPSAHTSLLDALIATGHPTLALWARLERLMPGGSFPQ